MEEKIIQFDDPFKKKSSRADLTYTPLCRDLKDAMYMGDLLKKEVRDMLARIIENYDRG